jgi:TolB-like protein
MITKALTAQSILEATENRAKWCQVSGHSPCSHAPIGCENCILRRGSIGTTQVKCAPPAAERLVSWKEVARYLQCNIRSVQRWERGEGLPVYRHLHQRGSTVYAYSCELDAWLWTRMSLEASPATAPRFSTTRARLHVRPFVNLGNDPQLNLLCDGLTEEIIFQLARLDPERLGIIAGTTAMSQKTSSRTIAEIGRSLSVTSVMEGCLRSSGSQIRITAQLILVSDQTQVWTECFDGEASDSLQFQLEIARQIVHSLHRRGLLLEANLNPQVASILPSRTMEHFHIGNNENKQFQN